jgi:hypothetical protein
MHAFCALAWPDRDGWVKDDHVSWSQSVRSFVYVIDRECCCCLDCTPAWEGRTEPRAARRGASIGRRDRCSPPCASARAWPYVHVGHAATGKLYNYFGAILLVILSTMVHCNRDVTLRVDAFCWRVRVSLSLFFRAGVLYPCSYINRMTFCPKNSIVD